MYKKIFVPVDDSAASLKALEEACQLAEFTKASLRAVHVVDLAQFSWGGTGYLQSAEIHQASKEVGEKVLAHANTIIAGHGLTAEVEILESIGDKIATLLATDAKDHGCDLIVMGTHGWTGVMHLLMGSVAEGVLRQVDMPVMLVRKKAD
ncbi:MAG: universal stress protein [Neisseriaceae bacterium]|nr:universal stress protein [Neisseriaceae bacterium]